MTIRAIYFDVGETLVDETRQWGLWADFLGVPRFTFFAVLGGVIQAGRHHREIFKYFDADFDYESAQGRFCAAGGNYEFLESDFYPDVQPSLHALRTTGMIIGIAGNQPKECEGALRKAGIQADLLASSSSLRVEKPAEAFFTRLTEMASLPPQEIVYVGDRYDNDIVPAANVGMVPVLIRRGPWAHLHGPSDKLGAARAIIDSLEELPPLLKEL